MVNETAAKENRFRSDVLPKEALFQLEKVPGIPPTENAFPKRPTDGFILHFVESVACPAREVKVADSIPAKRTFRSVRFSEVQNDI